MPAPLILNYHTPAAAPRSILPLALASFFCTLPTVALALYLSRTTVFYPWWIHNFTLIAEGCALIGILLALETCRHRRWILGASSLLLNALTFALTPHMTFTTMGFHYTT